MPDATEGGISGKELATYLIATMTIAGVVGLLAWLVTSSIGLSSEAQLLISTQTPVFLLLLVWMVAIFTGPHDA